MGRIASRMVLVGLLVLAQAGCMEMGRRAQVGDVFVIALENHNLIQPASMKERRQILGNPAAPFMNSLITPGDPNARQISWAAAYYNAGVNVHPSESNYVWAEAGTDFGIHTDADPDDAAGNTGFNQADHLTAQMDAAGIPWKNYQEDIEFSVSPLVSAVGRRTTPNAFNGSPQFAYAVKHNPMAFFADTSTRNVYPLSQLFIDLDRDAVGRYNWITPNLLNDAHSPPLGGFTYHGVHYTGDQAALAAADNFLSQVVPRIMASKAYRRNGVIILWCDETEGGDDTEHVMPEIIISRLAKGNAYASKVPMSHSSDLKTMEEIFHLPLLDNPIPADEPDVTGKGYNAVRTVNDLGDLFVPGIIPARPGGFSGADR